MPSLQNSLLVLALKATRRKRPYLDPKILRARIEREQRTPSFEPPSELRERCAVTMRQVKGLPCFTVSPRSLAGSPRRKLLYLHGGCYVAEIVREHWAFVGRLANALDAAIDVPIYPLAPKRCHRDVFPMITEVYRELARDTAPSSLAIIGDSAGGGMGLALAQSLTVHELPQPKDVVLISPWIDITMSNPDIANVDDPWLAPPGLIEAGRLYAAGDDPRGPRVSPIYGAMEGLPNLTIFIGTRDVFLPDCRRLRARAEEAGVHVNYFERPGMVHVWPLVGFLPEAKEAIAQIVAVVRSPD